MRISSLVTACALLAATAPQSAQAFRLGALITRARAPKPLQKPDARKAWLDAAVVGPLPSLNSAPWMDAALRLAKRDAEAFVPELHATLTDTVHASPGATLKDVSAAVSQRVAAWAEGEDNLVLESEAEFLKRVPLKQRLVERCTQSWPPFSAGTTLSQGHSCAASASTPRHQSRSLRRAMERSGRSTAVLPTMGQRCMPWELERMCLRTFPATTR